MSVANNMDLQTINSSRPKHDALLIVSFGGPEGRADIIPFLENVLRGRSVPRERLLQVASHYELFGGVSPINEQNRQLIAALKQELETKGPDLPIYWGNRNWHPLLTDTMRRMRDAGIKRALAFVTSAYSSFSSCRQYLEDIAQARESVGESAPYIEKIRAFYNHPLFIEANIENLKTALGRVPLARRDTAQLVFTAHSIPQSMAENCRYRAQLQEASRLIADALGYQGWHLVYQSRSGPPAQPWLGPDVLDCLKGLKSSGISDVVIAPIGFVSDHMEIIYDLDTEARRVCEELGLNMVRVPAVGTHPLFIKMVRHMILERMNGEPDLLDQCGLAGEPRRSDCCLPRR